MYKDKVLKADSDIILLKIKDINEAYKLISKYKKLLRNEKYQLKLNKNIERIIKVKQKYKISNVDIPNGIDIIKINKEIDKINKKI